MLVLQIDTGNEVRGGQVQLASHLSGSRCEMHVAVPVGAPAVGMYENAGAVVHQLPMGPWPKGSFALRLLVRTLDPALVVAQTSHAHTHALFAAQGRPTVVHRRVDFLVGRSILGRWKYKKPNRIIAVSEGVKRVLLAGGVSAERICVVHDGVKVPSLALNGNERESFCQANGIDPSHALVLSAGALVAHKGHRVLVDAARQVLKLHPKTHFVIAGDGPKRETLQEQIRVAGLEKHVHLVGYQESLWSMMQFCDLFCHPSVEEGMGSVVVEAMLAKLPVVATSAGGLSEVVDDQVTGLLVPIEQPELLADALNVLLSDGALRGQFGDAGSVRASTLFNAHHMISKTDEVYAQVLEGALQ